MPIKLGIIFDKKRTHLSIRRYTENLTKELPKYGYKPVILDTTEFNFRKYFLYRNFLFLREIKDVDLLHLTDIGPLGVPFINQGPPLILSILRALDLQVPAVITNHGVYPFILPPNLWRKMKSHIRSYAPFTLGFRALAIFNWRELVKPLYAIIAVSHECKRILVEKLHINPDKVFVVHHGVDHSIFRRIDKNYSLEYIKKRYSLNIKNNTKIVVHLSAAVPFKNVETIIRAIHELRKKSIKICLLLAGPGHLERFGRIVNKDPHLRGYVVFIPFVKEADLPFVYCAADVFVYPSWHEGFGMPVLEAMSCAKPVIVSDIPTFHEIAGKYGIYVSPLDYKALSIRILELINDPRCIEYLGNKLYERSLKFTWEKTARETAVVYRKALKSE